MIRKIERVFLITVFLIISVCSSAQSGAYGAYSPYSIYGIGEISKQGTAYNKSMGGVGIASRNKRYINYLNPAAVTARDSLSFMADFGLSNKNTVFSQGDLVSAKNTFNIYDFVMSFPIYRSSAFMVGITPFSDVGYDFSSVEKDPNIIGNTGNVTYDSYGMGSVYQIFASAGATFWKRLSVGAEVLFLFGNIDKVTNMNFADASYRSLNSGHDLTVRGVTGKFGLQYEQKIASDVSVTVGDTYRLKTSMRGYSTDYKYAVQSSVSDTLRYNVGVLKDEGLKFGDELGLGLSVKGGEKWSAEFDYVRSDWSKSKMENAPGFSSVGQASFTSSVAQSFRAGFEIVPNRNDIRYYLRRCAYRAGVYYDQSYYRLDGRDVNTVGVTLGVTLPVFRWYNGISLGVDMGQRGNKKDGMIRERYAMFVVGFNIHDIWFQKPKYN